MMNTLPPESAELHTKEESHLSQPLTSSRTGIIFWCSAVNVQHLMVSVAPRARMTTRAERRVSSGERRQGGRGHKGRQNGSQAMKECFILSPTRKAQSQAGLFFFFLYKQGADCSPGAPEAKNRSVSSGSYATMAKIRLIHLSLVLKAWWLLFWKCAAWIMFSFNYHSFNYCVCVQVPEEGPSPPLTHNQEI